MNNPAILIIDDEAQIRKLLKITLESNGYRALEAATAKEGLMLSATHAPELVLLDIGLPDQSGHDVLQELRGWFTKPIIILSVQNSEEDIIKALDNGANDYLVKPFRTGELIARIQAALRINTSPDHESLFHFGDLQFDLRSRTLKRGDTMIKLTLTEYKLLALLAKNSGRVLTHHYLLKEVWGAGYVEQSQYLRVFIAQLRKKIENDPNRPQYILTESGVGYRFLVD